MQKHLKENGNIIYGDLTKQVNFKCDFKGKNNIVFFAGESKNINVTFHNNNGLIFIGNNVSILKIIIAGESLLYIDDNSDFSGTPSLLIYESKNIIFGRDCMFSWGINLETADHHLIYDTTSNNRINFSKSIYIGDHVWCGQHTSILKGSFIASGATIGTKSITTKQYFSNTINAGIPAKEIRQNSFWLRPKTSTWTKEQTTQNIHKETDDFKYTYDKSQFLSPKAIEEKLDSLNTAYEKLEFLYDALYCNKNKNRFAYFKDCEFDIPLPKYEKNFKHLKFIEVEPQPTLLPKPEPTSQETELKSPKASLDSIKKELNFTLHYGTAKARIHNHLSYKLGKAMIENSKSILGYIRMPYVLSYIKEQHLKEQRIYQEQIKKNPNLKLPKLESYKDYKDSIKEKECFTYKLGEAFIRTNTLNTTNNNKLAGGGGRIYKLFTLPLAYFKFAKEVRRLKREYLKKG